MNASMPQPPLDPAFWDNVIKQSPIPVGPLKVEDYSDCVVQPAKVAQANDTKQTEPPTLTELAAKAKLLGYCGDIDSARVCVNRTGHKDRHEAKYLSGPKDGQVIHWWPNKVAKAK